MCLQLLRCPNSNANLLSLQHIISTVIFFVFRASRRKSYFTNKNMNAHVHTPTPGHSHTYKKHLLPFYKN